MQSLIDEGVDLASGDPTRNDWTPLMGAVEWQRAEVVDALLAAGALGLEPVESRGALITRSACWRQLGITQAFLDAGADPDGDDGYRTALGQAAENGDIDITCILLDAGADPNKDAGGGSALVFALRGGNPEVLALLRERGAEKRYDGLRVEELRGAGSFDVNDMWLLVRAPVEDAARAFVEARGGIARWDRDVYNRPIATTPLCYVIFRFRGHDWTLIRELRSDDWFGFVNESDAEEVSRRLGARTISYGISDTAGAVGYAFYDSGTRLEHMDYGAGLGPDPEEEKEPGTSFVSLLRPRSDREIANPYEFADAFLREQRAYVPAFGSILQIAMKFAPEISFQIGGMDAEDFERVDIIHLPAGAFSERVKCSCEQMRKPEAARSSETDEGKGPGHEDVPF